MDSNDPLWLGIARLGLEGTKVLGIAFAGSWGYYRFVHERTHAPHIEFDVLCRLLGPQGPNFIAEFTFRFRNRGVIRHEVSNLQLRVRGIKQNDELSLWKDHNMRLAFTEKVITEDKVIPGNYSYMFVEPGNTQDYTYVSLIPVELSFILVRGEFRYRKRGNTHSSERVFAVAADANSTI
jgi:hypothetical protein